MILRSSANARVTRRLTVGIDTPVAFAISAHVLP
jgi:hypothetical protein